MGTNMIALVVFSALSFLCIADASRCTALKGSCVNYKQTKCLAGYELRLCAGPSEIRCCKHCDRKCELSESRSYWHDYKCRSAGGQCMDTTNFCPGNNWHSGKCAGEPNRKCCQPGSGECTLMPYTNSHIRGLGRKTIRIDKDFKGAMDKLNSYAKSCRVKVIVTSSFRFAKQPVSGAIVTPAKKSNHMVGHAIDMNLITSTGWCNSGCLAGQKNIGSTCFIRNVKSGGLTWGQEFNDPVHIDDRLNKNNPSRWESKYRRMQRNCK